MSQKVRLGINGFGRIGRISCRNTFLPYLKANVEVVQINDPFMSLDSIVALLNYDSAHGRFEHLAVADKTNSSLKIFSRSTNSLISTIAITSEKDPSLINWNLSQAQVVADCTGVFLTSELASKHLSTNNSQSSVTKVVLSAPAKSADIPLFVLGVNSDAYKGEAIISNASCTTNCLAPMVKAVNDKFPMKFGLMTTIHAATINQPTVDTHNKRSLRTGFSAMANIVPASTGAAAAVGKVLPAVQGILTGMAFRVPTLTGSVVDLTLCLQDQSITLEQVISHLKTLSNFSGSDSARLLSNSSNSDSKNTDIDSSSKSPKVNDSSAGEGDLGRVLRVDESDSLTSAGVVGDSVSSLVDAKACMEIEGKNGEKMIKLVSWYDNEFGYSCRLVELVDMVGRK